MFLWHRWFPLNGSAELGKAKKFVQKSGATRTAYQRSMLGAMVSQELDPRHPGLGAHDNEPRLARTTPSTNIPERGFREASLQGSFQER